MIRMLRELAALAILLAVLGPGQAFAYQADDILFTRGFNNTTVFVSNEKVFCTRCGSGDEPIQIYGYDLRFGGHVMYFFDSISTIIFFIDGGTACAAGTWVSLDLRRHLAKELKLNGPPCTDVVSTQIAGKDNSVEMKFTKFNGTVTKIVLQGLKLPPPWWEKP